MNQCKQRELVYVPAIWYGYDIICKNCGHSYGFSSDRDVKYLAALNRNSKRVARKRSRKSARR
jgi:hypothetical protein